MLISKFQFISISGLQVTHDYSVFQCSINYYVELIMVDDNLSENCSHSVLKWFQPNSFEEMCFLEERYKKMEKIIS